MSSHLATLEVELKKLRQFFIATGKDSFSYTEEDHKRALGYRVLAAAAIEQYVETECREVAKESVKKMGYGRETRAAFALSVWYVSRKRRTAFPLSWNECVECVNRAGIEPQSILKEYENLVERTHGMSDEKFCDLVRPLGLQDEHHSPELLDRLKSLAEMRNPASHRTVNRAKQMTDPDVECELPEKIFDDLKVVSARLCDLVAG